eukprot:Nk52_evm72s2657 gene=Nk52_evmTU72s2657
METGANNVSVDESEDVEELSAEELRTKLHSSLKRKGVLTSLKSQLRCTLLNELSKSTGGIIPVGDQRGTTRESSKLIRKAIDSLLVSHLKAENLDYTLSVYVPESGTNLDDLLSAADVCRALGISEKSSMFRRLCESMENREESRNDEKENERGERGESGIKDMFYELCCLMDSIVEEKLRAETSCQTETSSGPVSIDRKLQAVEEEARLRESGEYGGRASADSMQDKLRQYKLKCDEQYKDSLDAEIKRIREREIATVRVEESTKYRNDLADMRAQYEREYAQRYERLRSKEEEFLERQQRKEKEESSALYNERQQLLRDMEAMKVRQEGTKKEVELSKKHVQADEDRVKKLMNELAMREKQVEDLEARYERKFQDKCFNFELEFKKANVDKTNDLDSREANMANQEANLREKLASHQAIVNESNDLKARLRTAEESLLSFQVKNAQNEVKLREWEGVGDFKTKYNALLNEHDMIRKQLEETRSELTRWERKAREVPPELASLREEYQRAKDDWNNRNAAYHIEYNSLAARYQMDAEKFHELKEKYDFEMVEMQELKKEIADLRLVLHQTQNALALELEHRAASSKVTKIHTASPSFYEEDINDNNALSPDKKRCSSRIRQQIGEESEKDKEIESNIEVSFRESDALMKETEAKFSEINLEHEKLESAIKNFQAKMSKNAKTLEDGQQALNQSMAKKETAERAESPVVPHNRFLPIHVPPPNISSTGPILSRNMATNSSIPSSAYGASRIDSSMRAGLHHPTLYEPGMYDRNFRSPANHSATSVGVGPSGDNSFLQGSTLARGQNSFLDSSHKSDYFGNAYKHKFPSPILGLDTSPIKKVPEYAISSYSADRSTRSANGSVSIDTHGVAREPIPSFGEGIESDGELADQAEKKALKKEMKAIGKLQLDKKDRPPVSESKERLFLQGGADKSVSETASEKTSEPSQKTVDRMGPEAVSSPVSEEILSDGTRKNSEKSSEGQISLISEIEVKSGSSSSFSDGREESDMYSSSNIGATPTAEDEKEVFKQVVRDNLKENIARDEELRIQEQERKKREDEQEKERLKALEKHVVQVKEEVNRLERKHSPEKSIEPPLSAKSDSELKDERKVKGEEEASEGEEEESKGGKEAREGEKEKLEQDQEDDESEQEESGKEGRVDCASEDTSERSLVEDNLQNSRSDEKASESYEDDFSEESADEEIEESVSEEIQESIEDNSNEEASSNQAADTDDNDDNDSQSASYHESDDALELKRTQLMEDARREKELFEKEKSQMESSASVSVPVSYAAMAASSSKPHEGEEEKEGKAPEGVPEFNPDLEKYIAIVKEKRAQSNSSIQKSDNEDNAGEEGSGSFVGDREEEKNVEGDQEEFVLSVESKSTSARHETYSEASDFSGVDLDYAEW